MGGLSSTSADFDRESLFWRDDGSLLQLFAKLHLRDNILLIFSYLINLMKYFKPTVCSHTLTFIADIVLPE